MSLRPVSALALPAILALAACNGGGGDEEQAQSGEVLEGTISDAMLPLDEVRSQPPLADPEAAMAAQRRPSLFGPNPSASDEADADEQTAGEESAAEPEGGADAATAPEDTAAED